MGKKKPSIGAQMANARWKQATADEKAEAARNRSQGRWARWRAANGKPPQPGDEKFVDLPQKPVRTSGRKPTK